ncbi:MAG: rhomboid family intramembrane serine protease [Planctomycetes bacterium]|nr:rhomboid family intramembrane serine protease [Planctomycetota bacterium]
MTRTYEDPPEFRESSASSLGWPRLTPMVRWILWANVGLFLALLVMSLSAPTAELKVHSFLALEPASWRESFPLAPYWQLVTYGFVHSLRDAGHILFNMLGLYFFGTMLESAIGSRRFLVLYGAALVIGGLLHLGAALTWNWDVPVVGASGGVLAVVVAAAVLNPNARVIFIVFPLTLKVLALIMVGLDLFALLTQTGGNKAVLVHLGGAAWGFAALKFGWIWADPAAKWEQHKERKVVEQRQTDEERLDRLLQQIHDKGMPSLEERDRDFLRRMSSKR